MSPLEDQEIVSVDCQKGNTWVGASTWNEQVNMLSSAITKRSTKGTMSVDPKGTISQKREYVPAQLRHAESRTLFYVGDMPRHLLVLLGKTQTE